MHTVCLPNHGNILQWNISHSYKCYSHQELHWLGISHCIPLPSLIFDGPFKTECSISMHFTVPKDVFSELHSLNVAMILDHLDWTWPGGFSFFDHGSPGLLSWGFLCNGPMTIPTGHLEVHRRKVHALDTWSCKINVAFLESKSPGNSKNVQVNVVNPPEMQRIYGFFSDQKSTGESIGRFCHFRLRLQGYLLRLHPFAAGGKGLVHPGSKDFPATSCDF